MLMRINHGETGTAYETSYWLYCPGCEDAHRINQTWQFDGNVERPTFSPSILVNGAMAHGTRCHSFVKAGQWQFLDDCDHKLAGQTVDMVDLPEWLVD